MSNIETLGKVLNSGKDHILVPCRDKKHQESVRTMFYHLKKKKLTKNDQETIGISKLEYEGKFFIKLYKRKSPELWELNKEGIPVLMKSKPEEDDPELRRQILLMREAGENEEEIQKTINNWEEIQVETAKQGNEPLSVNEADLSTNKAVSKEKAEMKEMFLESKKKDNPRD
jgi:formylmethanofuran dehydrogenase subunit E